MGIVTPEQTERNKAVATDYKLYLKLRKSDPVEAAKMLRELTVKYDITASRIIAIGKNPKYK